MPRTYVKTTQLKLRLTGQQAAFLRSQSHKQGINASELLRRLLAETMRQWVERGWYDPDQQEAEAEQPPSASEQISIALLPDSDGGVKVQFPSALSLAARQSMKDTLQQYLPEIKALVHPTRGHEGQDGSQGRGQDGD